MVLLMLKNGMENNIEQNKKLSNYVVIILFSLYSEIFDLVLTYNLIHL